MTAKARIGDGRSEKNTCLITGVRNPTNPLFQCFGEVGLGAWDLRRNNRGGKKNAPKEKVGRLAYTQFARKPMEKGTFEGGGGKEPVAGKSAFL